MAPQDVIDYVIIHELAHIKHLDHSHAYWQEVIAIMPDFKERKAGCSGTDTGSFYNYKLQAESIPCYPPVLGDSI